MIGESMPYKVTKDVRGPVSLMRVNTQSAFSQHVHAIIAQRRPTKIIETGTFEGTGTTAVIASAIAQAKIPNAELFSIEVNPLHISRAAENVRKAGLNVRLMFGLSIPKSMVVSREQIQERYVQNVTDGVFVDWYDAERADQYFKETDFAGVPDDMLGKLLTYFQDRPDFLLLDSAGHLGHVEFQYAVSRVKSLCVLALDDTRHVKHFQSVLDIKKDSRFKVLVESDEKFGFCIAEFNP
jgi:hypothetical protein